MRQFHNRYNIIILQCDNTIIIRPHGAKMRQSYNIMLQPLNQHATLSIKIGPHGAKMRQSYNLIATE